MRNWQNLICQKENSRKISGPAGLPQEYPVTFRTSTWPVDLPKSTLAHARITLRLPLDYHIGYIHLDIFQRPTQIHSNNSRVILWWPETTLESHCALGSSLEPPSHNPLLPRITTIQYAHNLVSLRSNMGQSPRDHPSHHHHPRETRATMYSLED